MTDSERLKLIRSRVGKLPATGINRKTGGPKGSGNGSHKEWSSHEDRIVRRTDISVMAMVRLTGRSFKAVQCRRSKLPGVVPFKIKRHSPK